MSEYEKRSRRPAAFRARPLAVCAIVAAVSAGAVDASRASAVVGPPDVPARLRATPDAAVDAVRLTVGGAARAIELQAALFGAQMVLGGEAVYGDAGDAGGAAGRPSTVACGRFVGPAPCAGVMRVEREWRSGADVVPAGAHARVTFQSLSAAQAFGDLRFDGPLELAFDTPFERDAERRTRESVTVRFEGYRGLYAGLPFGPVEAAARLEIDVPGGRMRTTSSGLRWDGLELRADSGEAGLAGGRMRLAHPARPGAYVDAAFERWSMAGERPVSGSATVSAGGPVRLRVRVVASEARSVVYSVVAERRGVPVAHYRVTARYADAAARYTVSAG